MNRSVLWRHREIAPLIASLLAAIGLGLAWWAHASYREAVGRMAGLNGLANRVRGDVIQAGDALQAWMLDPKNNLARKPGEEAQADLTLAVNSLKETFPTRTNLVAAAAGLRDLQGGILDQANSDAANAVSAYRKNYLAVNERRQELLGELNQVAKSAVSKEADKAGRSGSIAVAGIGLVLILCVLGAWVQGAASKKPLAGFAGTLEQIRQGDLSHRIEVNGSDQFSLLGDGINRLSDDLSTLVGQVHRSSLHVNASIGQIAAAAREQQSSADGIAGTTAEVGMASRQLSDKSRELLQTLEEADEAARETIQLAGGGEAAIIQTENLLRRVLEAATGANARLVALGNRTAGASSLIATMTKVADQTNLLSLNAAIEAEKAGEYGLGFAVVAMEIRRLADQTAVAAYDMEKTIKEMQSAITSGVQGIDRFAGDIRSAVDEIQRTGARFEQVNRQVQILGVRFQTIQQGTHFQAQGLQEMSQTLARLGNAARQAAESLHQSNRAIEQLSEAAQGLRNGVDRFKVEK